MKRSEGILEQGTKWKVRSNSKLNFWYDKWLDAGNVRSLIHGPLRREEEQWMVKDFRLRGHWDFSSCSFVFFDKIMGLLRAVPFPTNHWCEDNVVWSSSPSGEFVQKSAYDIAKSNLGSLAGFKEDWVWKIDLLPKIKAFLWKCCHRSIPVMEVLQERSIGQDANCQICNNGGESILHVLRDCEFAKSMWGKFGLVSNLPDFFSVDLEEWLKKNLRLKTHTIDLVQWNVLFSFLVWNLWLHRNKLIFKGGRPNHHLGSFTIQAALEYMYCAGKQGRSVIKEVRRVCWSKPSSG